MSRFNVILLSVSILVFGLMIWFYVHHMRSHLTNETHVFNVNMRIAAMDYDCSMTRDKFHRPQLCNTILFETTVGEKLYREINTCKMPLRVNIDTKWLYNHSVGDTVRFDYLAKSEFFTIKKKQP